METAQQRDRLAKNQPAEITMFQISVVQESPALNSRWSFLALRAGRTGDCRLPRGRTAHSHHRVAQEWCESRRGSRISPPFRHQNDDAVHPHRDR